MYYNFDLESVVTPIKPWMLAKMLWETGYNEQESKFLIHGFTYGFDIEYQGPFYRKDRSRNIPLKVGDEYELWSKMMKEVKMKRYAGPFESIPFEYYVQSPIGLVLKAGNQTRQIFHLSFDFKDSGLKSINFYTPAEKCSVKYKDLDYAMRCIMRCTFRPIYQRPT